jgi:hypothetical protein
MVPMFLGLRDAVRIALANPQAFESPTQLLLLMPPPAKPRR